MILKRVIDVSLSFLILLVLFPILLYVSLHLFVFNKRQVFFVQLRPGKNESLFQLIKFKTMSDMKDSNGHLLPDDQRLTSVGRFIRKTSIDELPQLINVLKGDMAIVGPRPLLVQYLPLYSQKQRRRHEVKPGITGWAQINGRNKISWEEKFDLDVWYVDNQSLFLDIKILFFTISKVLKSEGVNKNSELTMEIFKGNN
jgi:undecaprenyl phosphate N,N'-diacetylbacillosamine 1-phosphate transferase